MTMKRILLLFLLFCGGYVHAQELDSVRIYYRQGHREVDVLFRDNRAELERFIRILREEYGANRLEGVVVRSWSSPEGVNHPFINSLKYNASLHFLYRHVDIITLLSCTLSESDCIYQKRSQQFIHALLTSYNTTHFIYFAASQTIFLFLNITSVFPPSLYIPPDSNIYQLHE